MRTLILIPARAGSKGVPGKNVKVLGGIPLIAWTLIFAKQISGPDDVICVSSDDDKVIEIAEQYEVKVPFKRPEELSTDNAGTYDVIIHALSYYEQAGQHFDNILILQPTSPFRDHGDYKAVKSLYKKECDMVVSVKIAKDNPYYNLFEEDKNGYLSKSKKSTVIRRQDCPEVYAYNGAFYLINVGSIRKTSPNNFINVIKSIMPEERSLDIDTKLDWAIAEYILNNQ